MKNLIKAVLEVMKDVENIDKKMDVGSGTMAYKGIADKDVKLAIGKSMQKHGLVMFPIEITPTVKVDRWEEETFYNGQKSGIKSKQAVFTEVNTKYLLAHTSGESMEIAGYGHGVDSQDKSAGKATTYALKNALLYTFLVPTGAIDDTDKTHSEDSDVPKNKTVAPSSTKEPKIEAPAGVAPSLAKVVKNAKSLDSLNIIWNNNAPLHENVDFLKMIAMKRVEFANSVEELTEIFNSSTLLHADSEFVNELTKAKAILKGNVDKKQTA